MAADILHNIAVLRGQIAAEAAGDPSLLRFAAQRGSDLSDMGEAGCAAAAEWQPRGSSRTSSGSSGSFDDDSVRRARVRALRDDAAARSLALIRALSSLSLPAGRARRDGSVTG